MRCGSTDTTLAVVSVYAGLNGTDKQHLLSPITGTIGILGTVGTNSAAAGGSSVISYLKQMILLL